jgi:copper homeostasis protein (lipoprotein)
VGLDKTVFANGTVVTPMKSGAFSINLTQDGRVNGTTDCNGFGGEYQVGSDGIITFGEFMSTQMYCEGSQEGEFNSMITKVKSYSLDLEGNLVMILNNNEGSIFFKKKVGIIN